MRHKRTLGKSPGDLFIRAVMTPDGISLGCVVCVLKQDDPNIQQADLLVLRHCAHRYDAEAVERGFQDFLARERKMIAELAYPSDVWEWNALPQSGSADICWTVLVDDDLEAFRTDRYTLTCTREDWYPSASLIDAFQTHPKLGYLHDMTNRLLNEGGIGPGEPSIG